MTSQPITEVSQASSPFFFGIDVGGTGIKIGLVDDSGMTIGFTSIPTEEPKGPEDAMRRVGAACSELLKDLGLDWDVIPRVGLGTPGSQDIPKGMLIAPPNHPHWHNFPIVPCLERELKRPVSFANDANAAAFGEFWVGTGAIYSSMVLLTLGTGVGGGIIVDNQLVVGQNSFGGECGHLLVDSRPDARLCVWGGGRGHLEAYASASAVAARAKEALLAGADSCLRDRADRVTARMIYEAAETGDTFSLKIIDETADYLAIGITTLVHTLDPGLVVLGGAMDFGGNGSPIGQRFLNRIKSSFRERSFEYVANGTTIDFASLGGDAGYLGAAGIARMDHHKKQ
ncbi:ROK family protein [Pirellulaceae bacterium SH449]